MNKQQGMALVLVLWILSLLTIMAGSFALSMRRETVIVAGLKDNAQAMAVTESGVTIAEFMLLNPDPNKRWRADGSIYQIDAENAKLRIRLLSETGKVNINLADQNVLENMMKHAPNGSAAQLPSAMINRAAAMIDWRDSDDLVSINGAEKKQYQNASLNDQPSNKPFQTLEELQRVLSMDEATLKWLEPLITVYSDTPEVNLQLASKDVLQVLSGANAELIDVYVAARAESAKQNLPAPTSPLDLTPSMPNADVTLLTIVSELQFDDQASTVINAVVKKSDGSQTTPFQVLRWQQNPAHHKSLFSANMNPLVVKHYAESEFNH